ncbi:hypothetical protein WKH57_01490 [Niallia taxi]|uniref:hypothetical protein n=1 Tax=Niallia taxi TaxID=2499688 RepID=UPI003175F835
MKRFSKEREFDRINDELLNKIFPMGTLRSYFVFGVAETLYTVSDVADEFIEEGESAKMDANYVKELVKHLLKDNEELTSFYERLRNEGIETKKLREDFNV